MSSETPIPAMIHTAGAKTNSKRTMTPIGFIWFVHKSKFTSKVDRKDKINCTEKLSFGWFSEAIVETNGGEEDEEVEIKEE